MTKQKTTKHPDTIAWENWIESNEGVKAAEGETSGYYLQNRLLRAFMAGVKHGSTTTRNSVIDEIEGWLEHNRWHWVSAGEPPKVFWQHEESLDELQAILTNLRKQ